MKILNMQKQAFIQNLEKAFSGQGVYQDNYKNRKLGRVGQPYKKETSSKEENEEPFRMHRPGRRSSMTKEQTKEYLEEKYKNKDIKSQKMSDEEIERFGFIKAPDVREGVPSNKLERYFDNKTKKILYDTKSNSFNLIDYLEKDAEKKVVKISKERAFELINEDKKEDKVSNLVDSTTTLKNAKGSRLDAIISYSNSEGADGIKVNKDASDEEKRIAIANFYAEAAENDASNLDEIIEDALADYVPKKEE